VRREKKQRGIGGARVNRVGISLSNKDSFKLNRLATACQMKPTTLAGLLVEMSLNNADIVAELQREHCLYSAYKIIPIKNYDTDELEYYLEENEREDM
jgi:hypothetical protein